MRFLNTAMNSKTIQYFLLLLAFGLLLPASIMAQSGPTGSLSGTVTDQNGAIVPGVTVTVKDKSTNLTRTAVTNDEGLWRVPVLPVGTYEVTYEKDGFKKVTRDGVDVEASVPRTLQDQLEVGIGSVSVDITTDTQPLVTAETAATAKQLTGDQLVIVPTSTRSFTQLLSTEAGVNTDLSPVATNGNGNQSPSVNGTRTTSTSLFFNGVDATNITTNEGSLNDNIAPAPETLQEVKLQTSLYDASTGRSGGGNFQLVTKRGGSSFNGTIYYYLQNKALNANDFFFNKDGVEKPKADRNEFGFTLGGPIIKEKFFFFGGYQYTKAETGFVPTASSRTRLPRALSRVTGDRTAAALAAAFNAENGCSGANCLTAADISPVAVALFNLRNPVTGDFIIPTPSANARFVGVDQTGTGSFIVGSPGTSRTLMRNNPLVEQRNVQPSEFKQDQFTLRMDGQLSQANSLSGTFFFANFPGLDSFPDPSSLTSPFTLRRGDRNRTLAISDTHIFSPTFINEARFGYFFLNNTRSLDDPFLSDDLTSAAVGITNPALAFDNSPGTARLGHFVGRNNLAQFSFGGPNDSFNRRKQQTFSFADNLTWVRGNHNIRFGGDFKRHQYDTNLPEEQATEFEKFDNLTQLLTGNATEADTQFGITDKSFRFQDFGFYIADDWKVNQKLTLNVGLRYELFMWPTEKNGRIGNIDFNGIDVNNPLSGFIVPSNVEATGLPTVDSAINVARKADSKHTLNGQDTNNFAPRFGFAYTPFKDGKVVIRGGYGFFYDRPSAAFINTVFSNYPFLREVEITVPSGNVPIANAFNNVPTTTPLNVWLPFRIIYNPVGSATGTYSIRDNTPVFVDPRGNANPPDTVGGGPARGNIAETFEFRAVDRNLKTPYVQQWNLGFQYEFAKDFLFEARYVGTKGTRLLQSVAFNQGYDLNDPNTPDFIFERFNQAYVAAGSPRGALNSGATARARGVGRAFGFTNSVTGRLDYNLANPGGAVINFEARVPILGFNVPEALLLKSDANSIYHGLQFNLTKRLSKGLHFNLAYTFSKSIDVLSSDPGSTAGSGKPDVPNTGFVVQSDQRNLKLNRAVSDFDRPHRFSGSFVYEIPNFGSNSRFLNGWQLSGFVQIQSGAPYSIFASEPELGNLSQLTTGSFIQRLARGSGGLFRLGFGRPNLCGSLDQLRRQGSDVTEQAFDASVLCSPLGGVGNLGRNVLRGETQTRTDIGLSKTTKITERFGVEFRWDVFNVFNKANFALPNSDLQDSADFGKITNTVGGPRVMQFGFKLKF